MYWGSWLRVTNVFKVVTPGDEGVGVIVTQVSRTATAPHARIQNCSFECRMSRGSWRQVTSVSRIAIVSAEHMDDLDS